MLLLAFLERGAIESIGTLVSILIIDIVAAANTSKKKKKPKNLALVLKLTAV